MQRLLSVNEMRLADEYTINKLGISADILTERAGTAVAQEIIHRLKGGRVLVCVGKGNNGKDGKIIADILSKIHGFTVATINVENGIFKLFDKKFDIIVDCIFGTGLNRKVSGKFLTAIEKINNSGAFVVSCDIPSGINGDTGEVMGVAVKANLTIAVQELKLGHFFGEGRDYCGEIVVRDIGISVWGEGYSEIINPDDAKKFFEKRKKTANKGNFGKSVILGGSKCCPGSVMLSTNGLCALKGGAGYCALAVPNCIYGVVAGVNPECTLIPLSDNGDCIVFNEKEFLKILNSDSIALGMGMGVNEQTYKIIAFILNNYSGKLVIDADGLNSIAEFGLDILKNKKCEVILTPHLKEFSRLIGKDIDFIKNDIINISKNFAKEYSVNLLLKSNTSVITDGQTVYVNTSGCPAMAKGGSGDVLSGFLCGVLARTEDVLDCVASCSYIFGKAGEIATKNQNEYTLTASEIIKELPTAINGL